MIRNMALMLSIAALSGVAIAPVHAAPANNNASQQQAADAQLQAAMNTTPINEAAVQSMTAAYLQANPQAASQLFASVPSVAVKAVAKGAKQAADSFKGTNPQAYNDIQNAILAASPEFQAAYLEISDEDATAAISGNAAPTATVTGSAGGGGGSNTASDEQELEEANQVILQLQNDLRVAVANYENGQITLAELQETLANVRTALSNANSNNATQTDLIASLRTALEAANRRIAELEAAASAS